MSSERKSPSSLSNRISDIDIEKSDLSDCSLSSKSDEPVSVGTAVAKLTVAAISGILFGIASEKSRVFEPMSIRQQMVFENFIMLKIFLSATATSQLVLCMLSVIPKTKDIFNTAREEFVGAFSEKGVLSSALGAFILGIGMALSGACPGMVLAQIGVWVPNAIFSLLGVLVGALTYGLLATVITRYTKPKAPYKKQFVYQSCGVPFIALGLPMAIAIGVGVFLCEWFWSWTKDLKAMGRINPSDVNIFTATAWPPYASGIIIGLLQFPLVLVLKDTIGGSSSYVTLVSQWVITEKLQSKFPYLAKKRSGIGNWWQVLYVSFAVIGALISAAASQTLSNSVGVPAHVAFIGGLVMAWGARFASGCTSGHGLSGMALLAWLSFLAVPCMFAGGITTAFSMQATGALDYYVVATGDA